VARTPPKVQQAVYTVRAMIAEGLLKPGDIAPSVPQLQEATGVCEAYCQRAIRLLVADGTLVPGPSPRGRPRVPWQ